jgi:hypothetical protein
MASILVIVFLAALVGIIRPYKFAPQFDRRHYGVAAAVSFVLIGITAPEPTKPLIEPSSTNVAEKAPAPTTSGNASPKASSPIVSDGEWEYSEQKDEMRGAVSRFAELQAQNTIQLDFPYGKQRGQILVRQSPQFGFDLLVGVPSGQIMCHSFSNGHINVKFDDGPIQRFGCQDASDGTSNMVFVQNARGFLAKLKKSQRVVVEAEFFQNGMQQMTFNSAGLKWE